LREMERLGLRPGVWVVVEKRSVGGWMLVRVAENAEAVRLGSGLGARILVGAVQTPTAAE
jgi:hypothetical protein